MVTGINVGALSQLYTTQKKEYSSLLYQISAGKEINKPSDDFIGYTRASGIDQDISDYENINTNLTELMEPAKMASDLGNSIFEDLSRMKELADMYASTTDTDEKATYGKEFSALASGVTKSISNNKYDGTTVVAAGTLSEAEINPDDSSLKLSLDFVAGDIPDVSSFALGTEDADDVQAEIEKITSYTVKAEGYISQIGRQQELNINIIGNKEETVDAITGIDEAKALAEATSLQVRQQATVSMMAQANSSATLIARLYQ